MLRGRHPGPGGDQQLLDVASDRRAALVIADRTKFLGAIRLPNNAFSKNAGTEVTTDLIFPQKRPQKEWGSKQAREDAKAWLAPAPSPTGRARWCR